MVYLDHAGSTHYAQSQLDLLYRDLSSHVYGNPHSRHSSSQLSTQAVERVRDRILQHFNTDRHTYTVIFTSGCTDSLRLLGQNFCWSPGATNDGTDSTVAMGDINVLHDKSIFCYFHDCHTSVVGMRELAMRYGARISCFEENDVSMTSDGYSREQGQPVGSQTTCHHLLAYPAQCNFSGRRYPLEWIKDVHTGRLRINGHQLGHNWHVLLDAAAFVGTASLDLSLYPADFVSISFYKMFGYPTGLGALLVRTDCQFLLEKSYFGGGTVQATISGENFRVFRSGLSDK